VTINAHGCGVITREKLAPGTRVLLDLLTDQRHAKGIVVDAVLLDHSGEDWLVGIELENQANFWGLLDAPTDWQTQEEPRSSSTPMHSQSESRPESAPAQAPVYPVHLTDLSPAACYLETANTFPVGSGVSVEFREDKLTFRCFAVVRLVHPQLGMGLEFTESASQRQDSLRLLIDLLIASGKCAELKVLVDGPRELPEGARNHDRPSDLADEDALLALILSADSLNRKQFLEKLRRQRLHPRT
jgi:hypothetical protein